jgi:type VI secretion system protein ImpE
MSFGNLAEQSLKGGEPLVALAQLQEQVRARPDDFKLRIFLFQLLCVLGRWDRALTQLDVASNLDPSAVAMSRMYGDAIRCEAIRADVFAGRKSPMSLGQPEQWLAMLIEALLVGDPEQEKDLRARAFDQAPTSAGTIDGRPFGWIADADSRLGPVLEAIINGRYYWVPFSRFQTIEIEPPEDLRDLVWMPARLAFENGGSSVALIPTRYPGSPESSDGSIVLARKTVWEELAPDAHRGLGQRIIATDAEEVPVMEVRTIALTSSPEAAVEGEDSHA